MLVAAAGYSWWATRLAPFTLPATVTTVAGGMAAIVLGWRRRRPRLERRQLHRGLGVWLVLAVLLAAWEVAAFLQEPRFDHPTISSLVNPVLDDDVVRAASFFGWLLVSTDLARR